MKLILKCRTCGARPVEVRASQWRLVCLNTRCWPSHESTGKTLQEARENWQK